MSAGTDAGLQLPDELDLGGDGTNLDGFSFLANSSQRRPWGLSGLKVTELTYSALGSV